MVLNTSLPRFVTRADLARSFGVDPRQKLLKSLRPVAILIAGQREIDLFEANIPASLSVNAQAKQA
jgi:hypothetical protein